jgi:peroxiredoxin Q/BCP
VREAREFRVHHDEFVRDGVHVAGVTREPPAANLRWSERLQLPYPMLSDADGTVSRELRVTRQVNLGAWKLDLVRRSTLLVDPRGIIAAVWSRVHIRGHAAEVLAAARAANGLSRDSPSPPAA